MKAQTKALVASLIIVALGLSAVSGVTYSWFSDTEQAEVSVTTASMSLSVELGDASVTGLSTGTFPSITEGSESLVNASFTISNIVPNDVITIPVKEVTIDSTIGTKYVETYRITSSGFDFAPYLDVTLTDKSGNTVEPTRNSTTTTIDPFIKESDNKEIKIKLGNVVDEDAIGKSFTILLTFAIYQYNSTDIPAGNNQNKLVYSANDNVSVSVDNGNTGNKVGISFHAGSDGAITVKNVTEGAFRSTTYGMTSNGVYLGGVDVVGTSLRGTDVELTFIVNGDVGANLNIYHDNEEFTPSDLNVAYDSVTEKTKITFSTNEGFSAYYLIDNTVYRVYTVDDLKEVARKVNGNEDLFTGKTVVLMNDLDLKNENWSPIGNGEQPDFDGTFDGNGKTIRNLYVSSAGNKSAALIGGAGSNSVIKNFTIDGAEITHIFGTAIGKEGTSCGIAAAVGASNMGGSISGVTVKNAVIKGDYNLGGIVGYFGIDGTNGTIRDCNAEKITLIATPAKISTGEIDNGNNVGGIVGLAQVSSISDCSVKDVCITAHRVAGLIGGNMAQAGVVSDCVVYGDNSISIDRVVDYGESKPVYVGDYFGRNSGSGKINGITDPEATIEKCFLIHSTRELANVLNNWKTLGMNGIAVKLVKDLELPKNENWIPFNLTDSTIGSDVVINGNNHSISGLDAALINSVYGIGIKIKGLTVMGSTVDGNDGEKLGIGILINEVEWTKSSVIITDCTIEESIITYNSNLSGAGAFIGYISDGSGYSNVVQITECNARDVTVGANSVEHVGGIVGHAQVSSGSSLEISGCSVNGTELFGPIQNGSEEGQDHFTTGFILGLNVGNGAVVVCGCSVDDSSTKTTNSELADEHKPLVDPDNSNIADWVGGSYKHSPITIKSENEASS